MSLHKFLNDFEIFRDDHRVNRPYCKKIENMDRKIATGVR